MPTKLTTAQIKELPRRVVELAAQGLSRKVIAQRLGCSYATVQKHLSHPVHIKDGIEANGITYAYPVTPTSMVMADGMAIRREAARQRSLEDWKEGA